MNADSLFSKSISWVHAPISSTVFHWTLLATCKLGIACFTALWSDSLSTKDLKLNVKMLSFYKWSALYYMFPKRNVKARRSSALVKDQGGSFKLLTIRRNSSPTALYSEMRCATSISMPFPVCWSAVPSFQNQAVSWWAFLAIGEFFLMC